METRLNSTSGSNVVGSMLREKYAQSDSFVERLIKDTKNRRNDGSKIPNSKSSNQKHEIVKRGEMSQKREDRKFSNIRNTKKNNSSPKNKLDKNVCKDKVKLKDKKSKKEIIINQGLVECKYKNALVTEQTKTDILNKEVDENSQHLEIKEEPSKVNNDIKDFMSIQSADKQSLNNSVITDSINETRIKAANNK